MNQFLSMKAPRYTSYPTAVQFKQLSSNSHQEWITQFDNEQGLALYLHIPFCRQLCWFCACHTQIVHRDEIIRDYCHSLGTEIDLINQYRNKKMKVHTIHFGGGSPSLIRIKELDYILTKLHSEFEILPTAEIAIEIDPRTLEHSKITDYQRLGINRISLGVQDLNATVQDVIHRKFSLQQLQKTCESLRAADLQQINFDLIYGLPFQTLESLKETIDLVHLLSPSRIALYSFAHLPHLKKHHKVLDPSTFPTEETKADMYLKASAWLENYAYMPLGIDHFVKQTDHLFLAYETHQFRRNFMGYTAAPNEYVLGIGISAVSQLPGGFAQNTVTRPSYVEAIAQGHLATERGWIDRPEDKLRRRIIQDLMCYFFVDIPLILKEFGYEKEYLDHEISLLKPWVTAKIILLENRKITFLSPLRMLVRSICTVFDTYYKQVPELLYSKVG